MTRFQVSIELSAVSATSFEADVVGAAAQGWLPCDAVDYAAMATKSGLTYETTEYTQPVTLGIDAGYQTIGYSAITDKEELIGRSVGS